VERATRNYHSKIEFLDNYIESQRLPVLIPIEAIVWYHQLRNELYHSGNGMVPEIHVLEGARAATVTVFNVLFKTDISTMLGEKPTKPGRSSEPFPFIAQNDQMEFLRLFIEFERTLEKSLQSHSPAPDPRRRSVRQMWEDYKRFANPPKDWDKTIQSIVDIRNRVAHGQTENIRQDDFEEAYINLMEFIDAIAASGKKSA